MHTEQSRLKNVREKTGFFNSFPQTLKNKLMKSGLVFLAIVATAPIGITASNASIDKEIAVMAKGASSFDDLLKKVDARLDSDSSFFIKNQISSSVNAGWAKLAEWSGNNVEAQKIASMDVAKHFAMEHKMDLDIQEAQTPCSPEEMQMQAKEYDESASRTGVRFQTECEMREDYFKAVSSNPSTQESKKFKI